MTTRNKQTARRLYWKQTGKNWHLIVDGLTVARIIHHPEGYLSRIDRQPDNGWSNVDFSNLAHAKACLMRWWSRRNSFLAFYVYCTTPWTPFE